LRAIRSTRLVISDAARPGKRHQQDAAGVRAAHDQMRHPMGEGVGLAGSGAGDDQQRRAGTRSGTMLDRTPLFRIEVVEVGGRAFA
jgi:hypothetical protein